MGSISILASLGFMSAAIYFTFNPNINLEQPTFDEGIDTVVFTIGNDSQQESVAQLRAAKQRFFLGDIPAFLYVEGNKPYVDVDILTPPGEPPVRLRHNRLMNRPDFWDMNSDKTALEVVNEKQQPVFQFIYKSPSHIVIYGLFFNGYVPWLAYEGGIRSTPKLDPYPLRTIFKYPSSDHPGERGSN